MLCFDMAVNFRNMCFDIYRQILYIVDLGILEFKIRISDSTGYYLFIHMSKLLTSLSCFLAQRLYRLHVLSFYYNMQILGGKNMNGIGNLKFVHEKNLQKFVRDLGLFACER